MTIRIVRQTQDTQFNFEFQTIFSVCMFQILCVLLIAKFGSHSFTKNTVIKSDLCIFSLEKLLNLEKEKNL